MAEKKYSTLALLDILITHSDEEHILTTKQIQTLLKENYDLELERRTIYSNIDILEQYGYIISCYEDNGKGYYLKNRQFEKAEILLLCNAIHASHFISSNQSNQLIKKLLSTLSKYQASDFKDNVYMPNDQKTPNTELMNTIGLVSKAIRDRLEISFTYLRYNRSKQLVPRRENDYYVEPRYIVYSDGRPYMIVTSKNHEGFIHYRLDRMKDVKITNVRFTPLPKDIDAYQYAKNKLFMFSGEMQSVTFKCKEKIMDQMIDLFGPEIFVTPTKDNCFTIRVNTSEKGAIFLAQQYLDSIEILEPKELRKRFKKDLEITLKNYK